MSLKRWMIPAGVAGVAALAALATLAGRNAVSTKASGITAPESTTSVSSAPPADFVEFRDGAGFVVSYPGDWQRVESPDPQVRLLATPNDRDSFQLRVVQLEAPIGEADLAGVKAFTDQVVTSGAGVQLVTGPSQIEVGGLPGWFYLYRFADHAGGESGIHSHYFLFHEDRMITFVFQALPEGSFDALAPVFDQIVSTFRLTDR